MIYVIALPLICLPTSLRVESARCRPSEQFFQPCILLHDFDYPLMYNVLVFLFQVMCIIVNIANASSKNADAVLNCDDLMRHTATILVRISL